jgi:LPS-assembly lipoprotein
MSWSRGIVLALALLTGCGFQPLYAEREGRSASEELAAVKIEPLPDRSGQLLYNALRDGLNPLGRPASPDYLLRITLEESSEELALRTDETATRVNVTWRAAFALFPIEGKEPVYQGVSRTITAFNVLDSPYATLTSSEDARARALNDIAREIRSRLAVFLTRQASVE